MSFFAARFYITFKCNSFCSYCNVHDDKFKGPKELNLEHAKHTIDELGRIGVNYIDFTGGEPSINRHITSLLAYSQAKNITTEVTTNGLNFIKHIDTIPQHVDILNVSLDTLNEEKYNRIRGIKGLNRVLATIDALKKKHIDFKIITVISEDNIEELPDLLAFAQKRQVPIYLSPLFSYASQSEIETEKDTLSTVSRYFYAPYSIVNLHFVKLYETLDRNAETECFANKQILTLASNGQVMLPCYHFWNDSVTWKGNIEEAFVNERFKKSQQGVGKYDFCKGCSILPYMGLSLSYHFNKLFLYQAFSEEYIKFKRLFLNDYSTDLVMNTTVLYHAYTELEVLIDNALPNVKKSNLLYECDENKSFEFFNKPITLNNYLLDNLYEHCWNISYSPHTVIKYFYNEILPAAKEAFEEEHSEKWLEILAGLSQFHLDWWKFFLLKYYHHNLPEKHENYIQPIQEYLALFVSDVGEFDDPVRIKQLLFVIASMLDDMDMCNRVCTYLSFKEELLAYRFLVMNRNVHKAMNYRHYFSKTFNETLVKIEVGGQLLYDPFDFSLLPSDSNEKTEYILKRLTEESATILAILPHIETLPIKEVNALIRELKSRLDSKHIALIQQQLYLANYEHFTTELR